MIEMGVNGAAGRMGQALIRVMASDPEVAIVAAMEAPGHPKVGQDAGVAAGAGEVGVPISDTFKATPRVLVDFSSPLATLARLPYCMRANVGLVIGTTGFSPSQQEQVESAAHQTAVLQAPNTSVGVNLLYQAAAQVARALGDDFDLEIIEAHHRFKADAPSGTALALARTICDVTGRNFDETVVFGREGRTGERPKGQIGIHAVRAGDIIGEHRLLFSCLGERIELMHMAHTRDAFAHGALRAAKFVSRKGPGRYTMADVLAEPNPRED